MPFRSAAAYVLSAVLVILAAQLGLAEALGAHPFWAVRTAWIGAPLGVVLAVAARYAGLLRPQRVLLFAALLIPAAASAYFGKSAFVASIAENRLAGLFWHYGWIAIPAMATALYASALVRD